MYRLYSILEVAMDDVKLTLVLQKKEKMQKTEEARLQQKIKTVELLRLNTAANDEVRRTEHNEAMLSLQTTKERMEERELQALEREQLLEVYNLFTKLLLQKHFMLISLLCK